MRTLMFWTNGPRVTWDRMPNLALSIFILFNQKLELFDEQILIVSISSKILFALSIVRTSWMLSEQIIFTRQTRANEEGTDRNTYTDWTFWKRQKQKGEKIKYT